MRRWNVTLENAKTKIQHDESVIALPLIHRNVLKPLVNCFWKSGPKLWQKYLTHVKLFSLILMRWIGSSAININGTLGGLQSQTVSLFFSDLQHSQGFQWLFQIQFSAHKVASAQKQMEQQKQLWTFAFLFDVQQPPVPKVHPQTHRLINISADWLSFH